MGRALQDEWQNCLLRRGLLVGHREAGVSSLFVQPPPHLLPPEHCNYGSVTTLDWVLLTDRTRLNLSLSPAPRAEPGKTRGAWSPVAG